MSAPLACQICGTMHPLMEELVEELVSSINQACSTEDGKLDSYALSSYASSLRLLAKLGKVKIKVEVGRRVIAEWVTAEES